jgi:hypothetical protein
MTPVPQIRHYQNWLQATRGLSFDNYDALWRWSVTDLDAFWQSIWDYFDVQSPTAHSAVLGRRGMPGAEWFPGAQGNYAQQVLRHAAAAEAAGVPAIVSHGEASLANGEAPRELGWGEMRRQAASLALHLKAQGVQPGDRVAAYLPNTPETMVAFLAVVSLGAVWSVCAPDMGTPAVLDRFPPDRAQGADRLQRRALRRRDMPRHEAVAELVAALPSVTHVIVHEILPNPDLPAGRASFGRQLRATMRRLPPSNRSGCLSSIRCGSSIPAAPPACPNPSSTAMAALRWWGWRCCACTTTWRPARPSPRTPNAFTGTAPPAGSCGTCRPPACSTARPAASTTATRPAQQGRSPTGPRCGALSRAHARPSSARARPFCQLHEGGH